MAKKQTRRSISVSRLAYERLKSFCETSGISMSQFVESGINEKLDDAGASPTGASNGTTLSSGVSQTVTLTPIAPRPSMPPQRANLSTFTPRSVSSGMHGQSSSASTMSSARPAQQVPMTSAAARFAVEPPPPIIKPRPVDHEPKPPAEPTPGQIFTF
jgi:hypothetical protein